MFDFLRSRKRPPADFTGLSLDMHAHWLPGLDDGAKTMADSLRLIGQLVDMGYTKLIATPHVMADFYPNTPQTIRAALARVREAVANAELVVELDAAAEYLIDEGFVHHMEANELLTLPGKHVLVEFAFVAAPANRDTLFFELMTKGYQPILAHPERYRFYHNSFEEYRHMVARGVKLQVNILSLMGHYGRTEQKIAEQLIDQKLVHLLGTDAHHEGHLEGLRKFLNTSRYSKLLTALPWQNREWVT